MIEAYPLQWPVGYRRTPSNQQTHARFQTSFAEARDGCIREIHLLGGDNPVISSNIPLKKSGLPYSVDYGESGDDSGIAVYFTFNGQQKVICCDAFHTYQDNMQACRKSIEALRSLDRWKCSEIINQTFTGFNALPDASSGKSWWIVLGTSPEAGEDQIKQAYRENAKKLHPDAGGTAEAFNELQEAYTHALDQKK